MLRPSAPVFIPSGVPTLAVVRSEQGDDKGRSNQKINPQNQSKKKKRPRRQKRGQRRQELDETSRKLEPKNQNKHSNENNVANSKKTNKSRSQNSKSSQRSQRHNRKSRRRNQHPRDDSKTTFEAKEDQYGESNHDIDDRMSKGELELCSSLAFPALMEDSTLPPSSEIQNKLQSTIWSSTDVIRAVQGHDDDSSEEQREAKELETEKWQNGLDRLTNHDRKTRVIQACYRRQEFLSWDENVEEENSEDEDKKNHEPQNTSSHAQMIPIENSADKRSFDINKLRDRWWSAVADQERRLRKQREEELEKQDAGNEICADTVDETVHTFYGPHVSEEDSFSSEGNNKTTSSSSEDEANHEGPSYEGIASKRTLLDLIIEQNDDHALRSMIESTWNSLDEMEESGNDLVEYAITVLIRRNNPNLLRTILSITNGKVPINSTPLILAAGLGHEECASILLSMQEKDSTLLFLTDADGNTALHYSCRENGSKDMLQILLKEVGGNTKRKRQQLSKLITAQNKTLQTPLHIACETGRNDLVEVFLSTCKSALLFKVMSLEDMKQETPLLCAISNDFFDIVQSLLMWRRNHDHHLKEKEQSQMYYVSQKASQANKGNKLACPLVWAAKCGNVEMIDLLIQFGEQSGTNFQVTNALLVLLQADIPSETKLKGSNSLILAGGNPFQDLPNHILIDSPKETSIRVASKVASDDIIRSIISTALRLVSKRQLARRRDPILQHQPEAFFRTLESKENFESKKAISEALVETLFRAYSTRRDAEFSKAIALYENVQQVGEEYLVQLQNSLRSMTMTSSVDQTRNWSFLASYEHTASVVTKRASVSSSLLCDRSVLEGKSLSFLKLPWAQKAVSKTECLCPWMRRIATKRHVPADIAPYDTLTIIANDGSRFLVHASVVSEKSEKLASAIRFAQMKSDEEPWDESTNLNLDIEPDFCIILIQHMYHGSVCFGWPDLEESEMCRFLLELMIVAEEFLIPSLVQEIEMRLMSPKPFKCFCWDCCEAVRFTPSNGSKKEAQCLYAINGISLLVNRDTALDVLSLTDYLGGLDYSIFSAPIALEIWVRPEKMWATYDTEVSQQKTWKKSKALGFLRNIAILTILKDFDHVTNRPDFCLATEDDQRHDFQKQILLQLCLDELRNKSSITLAYDSPDDESLRQKKIK